MRKAIFFDRDGVLNKAIVKNDKPYSPLNIDQLIINNDAKSLIRYLKNRNFLCIVVTNQPEVGRGNVSKKTVNQINRILKKLFILTIYLHVFIVMILILIKNQIRA